MDLNRLVYWLEDIVIKLEDLDGYLFIDRFNLGAAGLREKAAEHATLAIAQSWMNIVLLEDFISAFVGDDWELDDPALDKFLTQVEQVWSCQIRAAFPNASFVVERMRDDECGDIGLRLLSKQTPSQVHV
jgi:hypothetical protein